MDNDANRLAQRAPVPVPVDALKRFADDLKREGNLSGNRFVEVNMGRVDDFIRKPNQVEFPPLQGAELQKQLAAETRCKDLNVTSKKLSREKGFYDYSTSPDKKGIIRLQDRPEFSTSLGPRSRFGEGDGGFLDRWLNSDEHTSSFRYGEESKVLNGDISPCFNGYKKHMQDLNQPKRPLEYALVKPYSQRRAERLQAQDNIKRGDKEPEIAGRFVLDGVQNDVEPQKVIRVTSEVEDSAKESVDQHKKTAYLTLPPLSQEDADVYFGSQARVAFFDFYHQMSMRKNTAALGSTTSLLSTGRVDKPSRYEETLAAEAIASASAAKNIAKGGLLSDQDSRFAVESATSKIDAAHFALPYYTGEDGRKEIGPGHFRQASARSRFIASCVEHGVGPRPGLLMRKDINSMLSLREQDMGDDLAVKLAVALEVMPYLQYLDISSNLLTQVSLGPIFESLLYCSNLTSLDISNNKFGLESLQALVNFLTSEKCKLRKLILQMVGMSDTSVKFLVEKIGVHNRLVELDLSRNALGQPASIHEKHGDNGVTALASMIAHPSCGLEALHLAWNNIHASVHVLATALQVNTSITHLDLSYNGIGNVGGEQLGAALHTNKSLIRLNLAQNKLMARSVFTIVSGVYMCSTLRSVDLSSNPIGDIGARAVVTLQMRVGIENIKINIAGCSSKMKDSGASFDMRSYVGAHELDLAVPYERAVFMELLRHVTHDARCQIGSCTINTEVVEFSIKSRTRARRSDSDVYEDHGLEVDEGRDQLLANSAKFAWSQASSLFQASGTLSTKTGRSKDEILHIWKQIGMSDSVARWHATELFRHCDIDGVGVVHLDELNSYVRDHQQLMEHTNKLETRMKLSEERYITSGSSNADYLVPNTGKAHISLEHASLETIQSQVQHLQPVSLEFLAVMAEDVRATADSTSLLEEAISCMTFSYAEARMAFKYLLKEHGDKVLGLATILPRMTQTSEARALYVHANLSTIDEVCRLKRNLGSFYKPCLGLYDGYYFLDMKCHSEQLCLTRLLEVNARAKQARKALHLGDISQNGDWSCFRNVLMNGESIDTNTDEFAARQPTSGLLQFDFSFSMDMAGQDGNIILPNSRLFHLLRRMQCFAGLDLMNADEFDQHISKLDAQCSGPRDADAVSVVNRNYSVSDLMMRIQTRMSKAKRDTELQYEFVSAQEKSLSEKGEAILARKRKEQERHSTRPTTGAAMEEAANKASNAAVVASTNMLLDNFATHVKRLNAYHAENPNEFGDIMIAMRVCDVVNHFLMSKYISCSQLAIILRTFLNGEASLCTLHTMTGTESAADATSHTSSDASGQYRSEGFSTMRVELVVLCFAKLVDKVNMHIVLQELTCSEQAILIVRLGFLNIFNVSKPHNYHKLDLARREEKQYLRCLLILHAVERCWADDDIYVSHEEERKGMENSTKTTLATESDETALQDPTLTHSTEVTLHKPAMSFTPHAWSHEKQLPANGAVMVHLMQPVEPALRLREDLNSCCLAINDPAAAKRPNVMHVEAILSALHLHISLLSEKQLELFSTAREHHS